MSPAYKKARQEKLFSEPKVIVIAEDSLVASSCSTQLATLQSAYIALPSSMEDGAQEDLLQCLWCRAVAALVGCLDTFASSSEAASSIIQAARASGTSVFLTLDRADFFRDLRVRRTGLWSAPMPVPRR